MITTYNETITDLKVNKIDRETFDTLSAEQIVPQELWFVTSADSVVVDIDKIGTSRDWTPEISALSADKRDLSALQYTGLDLEDALPRHTFEQKGIRNFTVSIPDHPDLSGDLVLSAATSYSGTDVSWWGNLSLTGNNMYMECRLTGTSEQGLRIYQFTLNKGSLSSHQTIHTFTSEEIATGVAPFQFTENDVTYDGVVSAEFATTRLATVNDISNHSVTINGQGFSLNAPYDQYLSFRQTPVTIEQDYSMNSINYTFQWYDGENTNYWQTNYNSRSNGTGALTIMLDAERTVQDVFSWAIDQGFSCEYCQSGNYQYASLGNIGSNMLSEFPYLKIVIG